MSRLSRSTSKIEHHLSSKAASLLTKVCALFGSDQSGERAKDD